MTTFHQANFCQKSFGITNLFSHVLPWQEGMEENRISFAAGKLALCAPRILALGFFTKFNKVFCVNAYMFGGNNLQWQPEAGQLWIWRAARKIFPPTETHTNSCIEKPYRDTGGHWTQQSCCLSSTGRRWVLAGFTKIREQVVLLAPEREAQHTSLPGRLWSETLIFESTDPPGSLMWKIPPSNQPLGVSKESKTVRNDA